MTTEERKLLTKDLCSRLPYGVKVQTTFTRIDGEKVNYGIETFDLIAAANVFEYNLMEVKPYLFPLSAMTEEVCDEIEEILNEDGLPVYDFMSDGDIVFRQGEVSVRTFSKVIDCLDRNHIDHRGLIPLGLAIDATNKTIY